MFSNNKNFQIPEIAIVRGAKKALPYSILPIGNKEALVQWRKDQALMAEARDLYLKPIRQATRDRVVALVANQSANTSPDALGLAESAHLKVRSTPTPKSTPKAPYEAPEPLKLPLGERVKNAVISIFRNAGFDI